MDATAGFGGSESEQLAGAQLKLERMNLSIIISAAVVLLLSILSLRLFDTYRKSPPLVSGASSSRRARTCEFVFFFIAVRWIFFFFLLIGEDWLSVRSLLPFTRSSPVADLIVWNGTIYTSDASLPFADSMAVRSGRVLRVGSYPSLKVLPLRFLWLFPPFFLEKWLELAGASML